MSDDEVIRFEITDYDLDNEFNPGRGRRANKEQQIYGMWAKDSDEDDNEDNVRQRSRKPKDFSAPIGFVAGGVQQAGKKKKEESKEIEEAEPSTSRTKVVDSSDEDERPSMPDESETAGIRRQGQGMRPPNLGGSVGNWEKHTKGIGAKLLLQMGYQPGKGLGKDLQGISAPVEATVRKGRGAIGAYGPEKAALKAKKEQEQRLKEKEEENKEGGKEKTYNWKKSHKGRYFYRDAADVIQEGKPTMHTIASSELSRVPVIDLTGRERRVLAGYHALRAAAPRFEHEPRRELKNFSAPHLAHNLEVMLECCEQDIIHNARELHAAEDEIVVLERDLVECSQLVEEHDAAVAKVEAVVERVERLARPDLGLEEAAEVVRDLKENFPLEFEQYGIGTVAADAISPLVSALAVRWQPLADPSDSEADRPLAALRVWRDLLPAADFENLLYTHVVARLESEAENWNPREPAPMLRAFSELSRLAPAGVAPAGVAPAGVAPAGVAPAGVVPAAAGRAVLPRVLAALRSWDPTGDTQPVHCWVLPWHHIAGDALATTVYPLIRGRLASALGAWHPADGSARGLLGAWAEAWGSALTALLHHHIVPKLEHCLHMASIDLMGGNNTAWQWCVEWHGLLGAPALGALAARALLPRWLTALAAWLNAAPAHRAVLESYTQFKKMFPEDVLREPAVRTAFRKALDMLNRSTDIDEVEPPPPPRFTMPEPKETSRIADVLSAPTQAQSFSELLETRCVERGITFVPIAGKTREGRPLYRIGELQCYVIRNVIMYSSDGGRNFGPIALDSLLEMVQ